MAIDRWLTRARLRLRSIVSGAHVDRELDEELQFHIDQQTELNISLGMTRDEARLAAFRSFGGAEQRKEECRDSRRVSWLIDGVRDVRHGVRLLARSPMFAAAAILSLGVGIAANVSMFAIVDALLLKKLPVPNPDGLVHFTAVVEPPYRLTELNFEHYERLRETTPSFSAMAAVRPVERSNVSVDSPATDSGSSATTRVALISDNYFSTLGISAARGRTIGVEDNTERPIAVVSDAFWRARLRSDPDLTAHTLHLNGTAYQVVGVTPPGFSGEGVGAPVDFWVPVALASKVVPELPQGATGMAWRVIARLAPGVSIEQATASALVSFRQSDREGFASRGIKYDEAAAAARISVELVDASRGVSPQRHAFRQSLLILMAGVALLLIVACANLANLLMARSSTRQRELAVRLAVGAGRGRIARQMLTESALIAGCGGLAGLAFAAWATSVLSSLMAAAPVSLNNDSMGLSLDLRIDPRVLVFATAVSGLTAMLSGLAPALAAQRVPPASVLRANRTLGLDRLSGPSSWLLVAQVAVSLVLLVGAGLFVASVRNLRTLEIGIGRERELLVWTVPGQTGVRDDAMVDLWRRVQERLAAIPGVAAVGASNQAILNGGLNGMNVPGVPMIVEGEPPKSTTRSGGRSFVTPGFFDAAGIRMVAGREFSERDRESASYVGIINASMARFYFGTEGAAVGRMVRFPGQKQPHQIVGVNNDYVRTSPRNPQDYFSTYFPYRHPEAINRGQNSRLRVMLVAIRTAGAPLAIADAVRAEIRAIDPLLPILRINTTEQQLDDVLGQDRLVASLSTALSAMALFLASLGLFGLLSYRVARRTNEIGVRLAFGATRGAVMRMVLGESGRLIAAGMVVGVIATVMLARFVSSRLYGVSASDPWTIAGAAALLTVVACIAALIPARQASTVDPSVALRCD